MQDKMMKMLISKKKEGKTLSDSDKKSKLHALQGMKGLANKMMGDKLQSLKKVTVASDSNPGLKQGLHKAEDLLNQSPDDQEGQDSSDPLKMNDGGPAGYAEGGKVGQLPSEFDRDEDHVQSEHSYDEKPREFHDGGMMDEGSPDEEASESPEMEAGEHDESVDELVQESPDDADKLDELIKKLEEKKQQLASR